MIDDEKQQTAQIPHKTKMKAAGGLERLKNVSNASKIIEGTSAKKTASIEDFFFSGSGG